MIPPQHARAGFASRHSCFLPVDDTEDKSFFRRWEKTERIRNRKGGVSRRERKGEGAWGAGGGATIGHEGQC